MKETPKIAVINRGPWKWWGSTIEDCINILGLPLDVLLEAWVHGLFGVAVPHVACSCGRLEKINSRRHDDAGNMNLILGSAAENEDLTGIDKNVGTLEYSHLVWIFCVLGNWGMRTLGLGESPVSFAAGLSGHSHCKQKLEVALDELGGPPPLFGKHGAAYIRKTFRLADGLSSQATIVMNVWSIFPARLPSEEIKLACLSKKGGQQWSSCS